MKRLLTACVISFLMTGYACGQQKSSIGKNVASCGPRNTQSILSRTSLGSRGKGFAPVKAKILRLDADRLADGERMAFSDFEVITK